MSTAVPTASESFDVNATTGTTRQNTTGNPAGFDINFHPILVAIAIFIVLANGVVLLIFHSGQLLRRRSNYLLLSLAISDMTTGVIAIPLNIHCECTMSWKICLLSFEANRFIGISTINHILLLTMEKYFAVMHPLRHRCGITKRNVMAAIATSWLLSLLVALIPLEWLLHLGDVRNRFPKTEETKQTIHETFVFTVFFLLPLAIMFACYMRMLSVILWHNFAATGRIAKDSTGENIGRHRRFKSVLMVLALLVTFVLSWSWWFFGTIQRANEGTIPSIPNSVRSTLIVTRYSSSFLNPLLYTLFKRDFKLSFNLLLVRCYSPSPKVVEIKMDKRFHARRNSPPKVHRRNNQVLPISNKLPRN